MTEAEIIRKYKKEIELAVIHDLDDLIVGYPSGKKRPRVRIHALTWDRSPVGPNTSRCCRWYVDVGVDTAVALVRIILRRQSIKDVEFTFEERVQQEARGYGEVEVKAED